MTVITINTEHNKKNDNTIDSKNNKNVIKSCLS